MKSRQRILRKFNNFWLEATWGITVMRKEVGRKMFLFCLLLAILTTVTGIALPLLLKATIGEYHLLPSITRLLGGAPSEDLSDVFLFKNQLINMMLLLLCFLNWAWLPRKFLLNDFELRHCAVFVYPYHRRAWAISQAVDFITWLTFFPFGASWTVVRASLEKATYYLAKKSTSLRKEQQEEEYQHLKSQKDVSGTEEMFRLFASRGHALECRIKVEALKMTFFCGLTYRFILFGLLNILLTTRIATNILW
jgi:hypothetical protein